MWIHCLSHAPNRGPGPQARLVPQQGMDQQPFGSQASTQSTKPHNPGLPLPFYHLIFFLNISISLYMLKESVRIPSIQWIHSRIFLWLGGVETQWNWERRPVWGAGHGSGQWPIQETQLPPWSASLFFCGGCTAHGFWDMTKHLLPPSTRAKQYTLSRLDLQKNLLTVFGNDWKSIIHPKLAELLR